MNSDIHLEEYVDFQKYWLVLKRRLIPATATCAGIVTLAVIKALSTPDVFEAHAEVLIKGRDQAVELTGLNSSQGEIRGLTQESDPLLTEAEIVRSRPIVEKLIQELDLRDDEGQMFAYEDIVDNLSVKPIPATDILEVTYTNEDPQFSALIVNKVTELYLEDHNLNNRSQTAAANKFIAQQLPRVEANLRRAEERLRNFKSQNGISSADREVNANVDSLSRISSQIDEIEAELDSVNASYKRLQSELGMSWQEATAVSSLSESVAVQRVLEQLQEVKVTLTQRQNYLSDNTPQIVALQQEKADLEALLEQQIALTLGSKQQESLENVNILSLGSLKQEQIANFAELGLERTALERQLQTLRNTYASYQQKSNTLPILEEEQKELERRVEVAESTYRNLLSRLQQTQIAEEQNIGNVRIVSPAAVPEKPLPSNNKLLVAGAGVAGALMGVAVAFLLDIRDGTLKNAREIEEIVPYSLIGIVPDYKKVANQKQFLLGDSSTANLPELAAQNISVLPIREAYHNLQFNLQLRDKDIFKETLKVIVITSAVSGEGKSSVAANLAIAKAQCGQKVLLVDGDLRCPTQHDLWNVFNDVGLANILSPEVDSFNWQDTVQQVMPNLDIIAAGEISKQPISLLNSPLTENFIASAAGSYDSIIFDSPPLVGLADTKILSKLANGLLWVIRPGVANYSSLNTAKKILDKKDFNVLGVIANGIDFSREPNGYEYYHSIQKYLEQGTPS